MSSTYSGTLANTQVPCVCSLLDAWMLPMRCSHHRQIPHPSPHGTLLSAVSKQALEASRSSEAWATAKTAKNG